MTAQEMQKKKKGFFGKSYALLISTAPKSNEEFMDEWRRIGAALIDWKGKRGKDAAVAVPSQLPFRSWRRKRRVGMRYLPLRPRLVVPLHP